MGKNQKKIETNYINKKQRGRLLLTASYILIAVFGIVYGIAFMITIASIKGFMTPNTPNSWEGLGEVIMLLISIGASFIFCPSLIAGICGLKYSRNKGKTKLKSCMTLGYLSFFINISIIYIIAFRTSIFEAFTVDHINTGVQMKFCIIAIFIICIPIILYLLGCYQQKYGKRYYLKVFYKNKKVTISIFLLIIIGMLTFLIYNLTIIRIPIEKATLPRYNSFVSELRNRNLIYDLPTGKEELTTASKEITAIDNEYEYPYSLGTAGTKNFETEKYDKGFPQYLYSGYTTLIKKSSKTASYYYKGPEDWTINWNIYYVNGQIYAKIGSESELDSVWSANLAGTRHDIIVSESETITVYNRKENYFSYDKNKKIRVVNRVDAKTLDSIAKELSPMYWKEYKHYK